MINEEAAFREAMAQMEQDFQKSKAALEAATAEINAELAAIEAREAAKSRAFKVFCWILDRCHL